MNILPIAPIIPSVPAVHRERARRLLRRGLAAALVVSAASGLSAQKLTTVELAGFDTGTSAFTGALQIDTAQRKTGSGAGRITGDFSDTTKSAWVTAALPLDLRNPLRSVSLWVRSTDARSLTVRIDDSTGQVHQLRPEFKPDGQWHHITIDSFESGPGHQNYGGAADGTVHWPATRLLLILEQNGLVGAKTAGTVWVDQIEARVEGEPRPAQAGFDGQSAQTSRVMLADFENGRSGFSTELTTVTDAAHGGRAHGRIQADLRDTTINPWITVRRDLGGVDGEIKALRFWVRSREATQIAVRLVDATGQNLQQRPRIINDGRWHPVVITDFNSGPGFQAFGGAGEKQVHWPAETLMFILEKGALQDGRGTVDIDDVEIITAR